MLYIPAFHFRRNTPPAGRTISTAKPVMAALLLCLCLPVYSEAAPAGAVTAKADAQTAQDTASDEALNKKVTRGANTGFWVGGLAGAGSGLLISLAVTSGDYGSEVGLLGDILVGLAVGVMSFPVGAALGSGYMAWSTGHDAGGVGSLLNTLGGSLLTIAFYTGGIAALAVNSNKNSNDDLMISLGSAVYIISCFSAAVLPRYLYMRSHRSRKEATAVSGGITLRPVQADRQNNGSDSRELYAEARAVYYSAW